MPRASEEHFEMASMIIDHMNDCFLAFGNFFAPLFLIIKDDNKEEIIEQASHSFVNASMKVLNSGDKDTTLDRSLLYLTLEDFMSKLPNMAPSFLMSDRLLAKYSTADRLTISTKFCGENFVASLEKYPTDTGKKINQLLLNQLTKSVEWIHSISKFIDREASKLTDKNSNMSNHDKSQALSNFDEVVAEISSCLYCHATACIINVLSGGDFGQQLNTYNHLLLDPEFNICKLPDLIQDRTYSLIHESIRKLSDTATTRITGEDCIRNMFQCLNLGCTWITTIVLQPELTIDESLQISQEIVRNKKHALHEKSLIALKQNTYLSMQKDKVYSARSNAQHQYLFPSDSELSKSLKILVAEKLNYDNMSFMSNLDRYLCQLDEKEQVAEGGASRQRGRGRFFNDPLPPVPITSQPRRRSIDIIAKQLVNNVNPLKFKPKNGENATYRILDAHSINFNHDERSKYLSLVGDDASDEIYLSNSQMLRHDPLYKTSVQRTKSRHRYSNRGLDAMGIDNNIQNIYDEIDTYSMNPPYAESSSVVCDAKLISSTNNSRESQHKNQAYGTSTGFINPQLRDEAPVEGRGAQMISGELRNNQKKSLSPEKIAETSARMLTHLALPNVGARARSSAFELNQLSRNGSSTPFQQKGSYTPFQKTKEPIEEEIQMQNLARNGFGRMSKPYDYYDEMMGIGSGMSSAAALGLRTTEQHGAIYSSTRGGTIEAINPAHPVVSSVTVTDNQGMATNYKITHFKGSQINIVTNDLVDDERSRSYTHLPSKALTSFSASEDRSTSYTHRDQKLQNQNFSRDATRMGEMGSNRYPAGIAYIKPQIQQPQQLDSAYAAAKIGDNAKAGHGSVAGTAQPEIKNASYKHLGNDDIVLPRSRLENSSEEKNGSFLCCCRK